MPEDTGKLPDFDTTNVNTLALLSHGLSSLFSLRNGLINLDERKKNSRLLSVLKQVGQKARCLITHLVCKFQNRPQNQTVSALLLVTFRVDGKGT